MASYMSANEIEQLINILKTRTALFKKLMRSVKKEDRITTKNLS